MGKTCDTCKKTYKTRQGYSVHLKKCSGEKNKAGRPKKQQAPTEEEKEEEEEETTIVISPPKKKKTLRLIIINGEWELTFEKTKKLIEEKVSEDDIKMAIKHDICLTEKNVNLRGILVGEFNKVCDPYRDQKHQINEDFKTQEEDKKEDLRSIINVDGVSVKQLEEQKVKLKNELFYVEYGLKIRELYPTIRALEMMQELLPEEVQVGQVNLLRGQSFTNLT
jgi:hypothetical protein